jgi:hypothetical protein
MTDQKADFLAELRNLLGDRADHVLYPCIRDLVRHGLTQARFSPGDAMPSRQDLTQYLAAWSRNTGLTDEHSRGWLVEYCATILACLSRRTPAAIRHSTKSNIKYIYKSAVPFQCQCEQNPFKADCGAHCPIYSDMKARLEAKANEPDAPRVYRRPDPPVVVVYQPVKQRYREQFEKALSVIREEAAKGSRPRHILERLEQGGHKTRTGRKWTNTILSTELAKSKIPLARPTTDARRSPGESCPPTDFSGKNDLPG